MVEVDRQQYLDDLEEFCHMDPMIQYKPEELEDIVRKGLQDPELRKSEQFSFFRERVLEADG